MQTLILDHSPPGGVPSDRRRATVAGEEGLRARSQARLQTGSLLHGRYRLCERLGAGGFGVVWRAEDMQLHREVALKRIVHVGLSADAGRDARERASREALATARLAHPAIVALYEAFADDDAVYLVSELVHGATLASLIAADTLSDEDLLDIGLALTQALAHAHARGVIHRDVKPHNVLIPHDPGPHEAPAKLTDFGGAHMAGEEALTRPGDTLGTLAYMAPEQSEGREAGPAADLYSLALVLYEGLTGANPVRGPTPAATARRIGRPLPLLATDRPDLPNELAEPIDTALEIHPSRRGTLDDLHAGLERACVRARSVGLSAGTMPGAGPIHAGAGPTRAGAGSTRAGVGSTRAVGESADPDPDLNRSPHATQLAHAPPGSARALVEPAQALAEPTARAQGWEREGARSLPLPRVLWLGGALAGMVWLTLSGLPGAALLLGAAIAPLLALGPRPGVAWLAALLAPLLGLVGLAGAYPALAGQARRWRARAVLGALGYWWLILAGPLLVSSAGRFPGPRLWLEPAIAPSRAAWERSLTSASAHVVGPALSTGALLGAALWALAAVVLPWVVRGRGPLLDALAAIVWSAALLAATPYLDRGLRALSGAAGPAAPRGLVVGAILAAAVAVAARALRGPVAPAHP